MRTSSYSAAWRIPKSGTGADQAFGSLFRRQKWWRRIVPTILTSHKYCCFYSCPQTYGYSLSLNRLAVCVIHLMYDRPLNNCDSSRKLQSVNCLHQWTSLRFTAAFTTAVACFGAKQKWTREAKCIEVNRILYWWADLLAASITRAKRLPHIRVVRWLSVAVL